MEGCHKGHNPAQLATDCCNGMNIKSERKCACAVSKCKLLTVKYMCGAEVNF